MVGRTQGWGSRPGPTPFPSFLGQIPGFSCWKGAAGGFLPLSLLQEPRAALRKGNISRFAEVSHGKGISRSCRGSDVHSPGMDGSQEGLKATEPSLGIPQGPGAGSDPGMIPCGLGSIPDIQGGNDSIKQLGSVFPEPGIIWERIRLTQPLLEGEKSPDLGCLGVSET